MIALPANLKESAPTTSGDTVGGLFAFLYALNEVALGVGQPTAESALEVTSGLTDGEIVEGEFIAFSPGELQLADIKDQATFQAWLEYQLNLQFLPAPQVDKPVSTLKQVLSGDAPGKRMALARQSVKVRPYPTAPFIKAKKAFLAPTK